MTAVAARRPLAWTRTESPQEDAFAGVVGGAAILLAGPPPAEGAEDLDSHMQRLGTLAPALGNLDAFLQAVVDSGLQGRGGAGFPVAAKMAAIAAIGRQPLLVVNGSESEPASRKDWTLLCLRPHLVLDGAALGAAAVGADTAVLQLHRGSVGPAAALRRALEQRRVAGLADPAFQIRFGPNRYVAGESSAVRAFLAGSAAKPSPGGGHAAGRGQPVLVQNVESVALLGLIGRHGPDWFRQLGTLTSPGPSLVTLVGAVGWPGRVVEVARPVPLSQLLSQWAGITRAPQAVLFGGYAGSWADGRQAWDLDISRDALAGAGLTFGCGMVGVLPWDACGLAETARILEYLAGESSGQCGPCMFGLPGLARAMTGLARGSASAGDLRRLARMSTELTGRGGCHHPDGAVALLEHALTVFSDDVSHHLRRGRCDRAQRTPVFPIPTPDAESSWR
ncbi:MAG TPA: NADH-ubiquinone oxidoreductase-F iron-sulfur binding region domain-containing protein [Candidatus Micrarchaeaceae archaeon]|nr:NADH-ubiquinone oxidoreductase-F iron-sulfur binding region domain-containing protein [Candidatus Micrarchaeaceae archaeon]